MSKGDGKKSSKKCLAYVAVFVVFQAAVIMVLALTVMKIKSPKIRLNAIAVESFSSSNNGNNAGPTPSINMKLLTQLTIKNTNFGQFKYDNATLAILYNGVPLGEAVIPRGRVKARKTLKFNVSFDLNSDRLNGNNTNLGNDINSGVLRLSSQARVNGKVHLMKIIKKNKSGNMNCDWIVNLATRMVENLNCK
ncbi:hypothetical protein ABFS82_05G107000 [Erythranthe guttata]|uniref:Late embryogenesis abundant protein LEA-2 subgroup domain-containing protein n=1 Tax=Erythranthe guttata TaxID=4155 RepID=A0A022RIQ4_ERYGU|nr:PREDICTED: uncharacterized protein LOC105955097 isoform X1 [Erythranthe guttata]EYU40056.1 hypothetical protein MIMGU_mgv1a022222mg [Erythranthe guttata]|eukprot:XP_012834248.1 PREDICTED: uncharacterized protein LOC105955097 isoform X1 [Erythranthe guttata]